MPFLSCVKGKKYYVCKFTGFVMIANMFQSLCEDTRSSQHNVWSICEMESRKGGVTQKNLLMLKKC